MFADYYFRNLQPSPVPQQDLFYNFFHLAFSLFLLYDFCFIGNELHSLSLSQQPFVEGGYILLISVFLLILT